MTHGKGKRLGGVSPLLVDFAYKVEGYAGLDTRVYGCDEGVSGGLWLCWLDAGKKKARGCVDKGVEVACLAVKVVFLLAYPKLSILVDTPRLHYDHCSLI